MIGKWAGIAGIVIASVSAATPLHAQDDNGGQAVLNAEIKSQLTSPFGQQTIGGRLSALLRLDASDIDRGQVRVGGLNLLFTDVPQAAIVGEVREGKEDGALGFVIDGVVDGRYQSLDYDRRCFSGSDREHPSPPGRATFGIQGQRRHLAPAR